MFKVTRLYSDKAGDTFFEELEYPLESQGEIGSLSAPIAVKELFFRLTPGTYNFDWHNAPQK